MSVTHTLGIDLGGSRLRVAVDRDGTPALVEPRRRDEGMPRVLQPARTGAGGRPVGCRLVSLKRLLDFDTSLPIPPTGQNSIEWLGERLEEVRRGCGPQGDDAGVVHCVMAVPPVFSQRQRSALRTATGRAGFSRIRLVDDTLAALLACRDDLGGGENVLVYSWGATTFSVCLYRCTGDHLQPVSQRGDRALGGDDLESHAISAAVEGMAAKGLELWRENHRLLHRLEVLTRDAGLRLAGGEDVSIPLDPILAGGTWPLLQGRSITLQAEPFESFVAEMVDRTLRFTEEVLDESGCAQPDGILLTGGMTQLSAVGKAFEDRFEARPVSAPEAAVACGAVIQGTRFSERDWEKAERPVPAQAAAGDAPPDEQAASSPDEPARPAPSAAPAGSAPAADGWAAHFVPLISEAEQHEKQGHYGRAIDAFEKLFQDLARFSSQVYRRVADRLKDEGRIDEAYDVLLKANRRDPGDRYVALDFAEVCRKRAYRGLDHKQPHEAAANADKGADAIRALPDGSKAYGRHLAAILYVKAIALSQQGQMKVAEELLEACCRHDPSGKAYAKDLEKLRDAGRRRTGGGKAKRGRPATPPAGSKTKPGRNDQCPCGSGKKYKNCCGRRKK